MKNLGFNLTVLIVTYFSFTGLTQSYQIDSGGTVNTCVGSFMDAGGAGNYSDNENYTMTFCSGSLDEITFDFSSFPFGLQANNDVMTIWDGPVVGSGAALWTSITGNGVVNPGVITSTTGCLTFEFVSDGTTNNIGWEALISCPSCSDGILNGNETDIDCGGPTCPPCANCFDGIQNGTETGIDCGGSCTTPCHCGNGILDGDETAIDCGGSCGPCATPCSVTASFEPALISVPCCDYTLEMTDSYGDGWNGGQMDILINGVSQGPFTLSSGSIGTQVIPVCNGDIIQIDYTVVGQFPWEVGYAFLDASGNILNSGGGNNQGWNLYNVTGECSYPSTIDCNGGDFMLTAQGLGATTIIMNNNFDGGAMGSGWSSNVTADFNNPCDPSLDGGTYMWMGNSAQHPREIETIPLDVSCGGEICFLLDFATQGNASPCEGIDLANEGVYLEYSLDGGITWITMEYYGPAGVGNNFQAGGTNVQMTSWNQYCLPIPPAAMTAATTFHWAQTGSSGLNNDHWGLDNVHISSVANCDPYLYDWTQVPGSDDLAMQIEYVTSDTTFTVWYGNNTDSCFTEVMIIIPPGPTADAGLDQVICFGGPAVTIGGNPVAVQDSSTYLWSTGDTGIIVLTGGSIVNGQIVVNPTVTTDYFLEVSLNGCIGYDTVTVVVDIPPTASDLDTINVQCPGDVPVADVNDVADEADDYTLPPVVTHVGDLSDGLSCPETITRTYRVTDDCGNYIDVFQTIVVLDTMIPVMDVAPTALSVQCSGDVPIITDLGWTDNCDGTGLVTGSEISDGLSCPETITRTWNYTDSCGNTATSVTQLITVLDTQAPVLNNAPSDTNVQCSGDIPAMTDLGWTDNCDGNGTVSGSNVSDGLSCPETITRTWNYTDSCGNTASISQIIIIQDTQVPVFNNAPSDTNVQCSGDIPAMTDLGWTDNCDGNGTVSGSNVSDGLSCPETITRTWNYTDSCGNNATSVTQLITVLDTQAPVFNNAPLDTNVQCAGDIPAMTDLGWTDNCDGNGTVSGSNVSDGLSCPETITRTWNYTDSCGNTATSVTQLITVLDTQAPVFNNAPLDTNVQCAGDIPAMTDLGWTDNCDGNGTVSGSNVSDGLSCPETITRTWNYTDSCGNTASISQIILIQDTQVPVFNNAPLDTNVQCSGDIPAMTDLGWTDNCDGNGTVSGSNVSDGLSCPETITRTWNYTDSCGNTASISQIILIQDTQAPVFNNAPLDTNVQCSGDIPVMTDLGWTDNCDGNGTVSGSNVSDGLSCPETITRTWNYTDSCGNTASISQIILIQDTQAPVFNNAPLDTNVQCSGDIPVMTDLGWTDNCDGTGMVTGIDVSDGLSCPETITRTWNYTDSCGNTASISQIILIQDTQVPVFVVAPNDTNVQCAGDVPVMTDLGWTDNCDGTGMVTGIDVSDGLSCPETITRTWNYTDSCGNTASISQIILIQDTQAPVFNNAPLDTNVQCSGDIPVMTDLGWTDNCDGTGMVTGIDVSDGLSCPETITRTWNYTDSCGNTASISQIILIQDTQAPVFNNTPLDTNVQCSGDVPVMTDLGWTDNCDGTGMVTGIDVSDGLSCPETITRTWNYTDSCGNTASISQIILIQDTQAPVFVVAPNDTSVQCAGDVPPMTDLAYSDNCDISGVVQGTNTPLTDSCGGVIIRTWTVTDNCGNTTTVSQNITVDDTIPPTASNLPLVSIGGGVPLPTPNVLDVFDEADNCTVNPVVVYVGDVSNGANCPEIFTRTYSVTDDCGNQILITQTISVGDAFIPTASDPLPVNVQCSSDVPLADPLVVTDEADNGAIPIVTWEDDTSDGLSCPETITRRYRVTDDCGNFIFVNQTITINDTIAPLFDPTPADITVQCPGDIPAMINLGYTDNCDGIGTVAGLDSPLIDPCGGIVVRTWTYVDACGNSVITTQNITVHDTISPTASAPLSVSVQCIGDVPMWDVLSVITESDNCTANPIVAWEGDLSNGLSCPETITRSYSITDDCGNEFIVNQIITVNDITPPTASNPITISVPSASNVPNPDPLDVNDEADNCTLNPIVTWISDVSDGNVCDLEEITRTYSIVDDCGNETIVTQLIIILAVPTPIDAGPDQTICLGDFITINASNPMNVPLTWSPLLPAQPFIPTQSQTYTVTADNFGCLSTDDVSVFIANPPVADFVADILAGCEPLTVNFTNLTASQNGFSNCEWLINGETIFGCDSVTYIFNNAGTYDVSLTVTSVEGCSSSQTFVDYINVYEIPMAQFSMTPNSITSFNNQVQFFNNSINADTYEWDFGDQSSISTLENPVHSYDEVGNVLYTITLWAYEEHFGCVDSIQLSLVGTEELIYYVPNTFTPDGDSYNETFQPVFTEGYDPYDFHMIIFNRWGEIIFETYNADIGWNGYYGDRKAQNGTYTWKIDFKETMTDKRHLIHGHVNILD
jgi:gliding motility-associated-like protein